MVFKNSNTQLLHITTHLQKQKLKKKKSNICLKLPGLFRFFHETQQFFEAFQNTQNQQLFEPGFFQIPGTGGSLVLKFFKYPRTSRHYKKSNTRPALVFGSDTCNAVNGLLLSYQTHSKFTPLSACSICTWMELLASLTQHPQTNHPWFSVLRPSIWMNPNF
jgi:hypothetical protein